MASGFSHGGIRRAAQPCPGAVSQRFPAALSQPNRNPSTTHSRPGRSGQSGNHFTATRAAAGAKFNCPHTEPQQSAVRSAAQLRTAAVANRRPADSKPAPTAADSRRSSRIEPGSGGTGPRTRRHASPVWSRRCGSAPQRNTDLFIPAWHLLRTCPGPGQARNRLAGLAALRCGGAGSTPGRGWRLDLVAAAQD